MNSNFVQAMNVASFRSHRKKSITFKFPADHSFEHNANTTTYEAILTNYTLVFPSGILYLSFAFQIPLLIEPNEGNDDS